jgi:hypothetical protein
MVSSFDSANSDVVFIAPSLPLEGLYSVIISSRRSRQLVYGIQDLTVSLLYETPIVGKALVSSLFPNFVAHNTDTTVFITLKNFVPVIVSAQILFSINQVLELKNCQVLFSSRSSTLVKLALPAIAGPEFLNISIWNVLVSQTRSADFGLHVQAPPLPVVVSVFPDRVEAASDTVINLGLRNLALSTSYLMVRTMNGTLVANASIASVTAGIHFF